MKPRGLLLVGPSGSGKTTILTMLSRALGSLHVQQQQRKGLIVGSKRINSAIKELGLADSHRSVSLMSLPSVRVYL
jgi:ABC-type proline/glycine betaine transport system ATPase subunit